MSNAIVPWKPQLNQIYHMDALTLLRAMDDCSVDCVITDPPYGNDNGVNDLAAARARDKVKGGRQSGKIIPIQNDSESEWMSFFPELIKESHRVIKSNGAICIFVGGGGGVKTYFAQAVQWMEQYAQFFHAIIWDKSSRGNGLGWRYRRNYEMILIAHKMGGKLRWDTTRQHNQMCVISAPYQTYCILQQNRSL